MAEQLPRGLLATDSGLMNLLQNESDIARRGGILPFIQRVVPDIGGDDISEYPGPPEWAAPALLYDPFKNMALTGGMLSGDLPVDADVVAQTMLDAPLVSGLLSAATGAAPKGAVLGANVFHGGPHRFAPEPDFPHGRPRLDKVGTGEGHQAFGWGWYSAEAPGVAKTYKGTLSGNWDDMSRVGDALYDALDPLADGSVLFRGSKYTKDEFDRVVVPQLKDGDLWGHLPAGLRTATEKRLEGTLYKLDIPDADVAKYLDWDKPLSEQPKSVRDFAAHAFAREAGGNPSHKNYAAMVDTIRRQMDDTGLTGKDFYRALASAHGSAQAASEALRKIGIPGLKYFDQDSRFLGDTIGQTLVVRGKEIGSDDLTGSFAANRLLESNMDFDAAKRIARGMGQDDVVKVLDDWATTPNKVSIKDKRTRNYVTWDQDVLDRSKMLERDGVTLGANKAPTAALPGLLGKTSSELRAEANALRFPNENLNINAELAQSAKDYFGVTRSPNETGYIMQDGTRLDLSGRHYAGGYEKKGDRFVPEAGQPDYLGGNRAVDHRELYDLKGLKEGEHQWDAVEQLMRETGAVRYMPNQGISIIDGQKVSDKQLKAIVSDFRKNGNSLTVDIDPVGGNSAPKSKTFDRPTVEGVREFIELGANKSPTAALPGLLDDVGINTTQRGNVLEITKIETPDNLRGQGLADQRLEQLIQQADADGTTLALTPSNAFGANKSRLTKWYKRHGFVPNKGRNKDFATRESMVRPPRNIELGANKAPTAALPGLLDDTASRMQRARDMGFDVDAYHGTRFDIPAFNLNPHNKSDELLGIHVGTKAQADNIVEAGATEKRLGGMEYSKESNVMPLKVKTKKYLDMEDPGGHEWTPYELLAQLDEKGINIKFADKFNPTIREIRQGLKKQGYDGIRYKNVIEGSGKDYSYIVFDPQNIRSRFAKFDPAKADSADLLAANPATAALPGLLQDRSGSIDQRGLLGRTPRNLNSFPMRSLLGQRLYTATAPDGSI